MQTKTRLRSKGSVMQPTIEDVIQVTGRPGHDGGSFRLKVEDRWAPLKVSAHGLRESESNTIQLQHRNWRPHGRQAVGEMNSIQRFTVSEMESKIIPAFVSEIPEVDLLQNVGEMITTSQGAMDLLEKVRFDIDTGLAEVPLLYQPLYERINGPFPGGAAQIGGDVVLDANVIFQQKMEAGEVVFGTLSKAGAPTFTPILTYAAGFEWTEDMLEYDRTYEIGMNARAFGRAYNYLLNHLHFSPILAYSYGAAGAANHTGADATAGVGLIAHTLLTFQAAYRKAAMATTQRIPSWILANEADRFTIEDALLAPVLDASGNTYSRVPVEGIIYYNGATVTNGVVQSVYPGVTAGTCYFIAPRLRMKELVHHDMRVDVGPADISRLIEGQQVARTRRGSYLDIANSVEKITLPTS